VLCSQLREDYTPAIVEAAELRRDPAASTRLLFAELEDATRECDRRASMLDSQQPPLDALTEEIELQFRTLGQLAAARDANFKARLTEVKESASKRAAEDTELFRQLDEARERWGLSASLLDQVKTTRRHLEIWTQRYFDALIKAHSQTVARVRKSRSRLRRLQTSRQIVLALLAVGAIGIMAGAVLSGDVGLPGVVVGLILLALAVLEHSVGRRMKRRLDFELRHRLEEAIVQVARFRITDAIDAEMMAGLREEKNLPNEPE
jgi:hypothetical protein